MTGLMRDLKSVPVRLTTEKRQRKYVIVRNVLRLEEITKRADYDYIKSTFVK